MDIDLLLQRLDRIEDTLRLLTQQKGIQEFYSTTDLSRILGKAEFTVREWCRHGRIKAEKRPCGRGNSKEWMVSPEELQRVQSAGLLPVENGFDRRLVRRER